MFGVSMPELLLLLVVVLLVFGSNKLPEIGGGLGRAIRNFRRSSTEPDEIDIKRNSFQFFWKTGPGVWPRLRIHWQRLALTFARSRWPILLISAFCA